MATNIDDLRNKVENEGLTEQGRLGATEFNRLVTAVIENQNGVKSVSIGSGDPVYPDDSGNVQLVIATGNYAQILSVKRTVNGEDVDVDNNSTILSRDTDVQVKVQFIEYQEQMIEGEVVYIDTNKECTLSVYKDTSTTPLLQRSYIARGRGSTEFEVLDLAPYLSVGTQSIRISITNTTTGEERSRQFYVTDAGLRLSVPTAAPWFTNAMDVRGVTNPDITMRYFVQGPVQKTLVITLYGDSGQGTATVSYSAAVDDGTTAQVITWQDVNQAAGFFTTGVHRVSAKLVCTIEDQTVESNVVENNVIIIADDTAEPMIAIQNPLTRAENYETVTFFDYTIYNPSAASDGSTVSFDLSNNNHSVIYLTSTVENVPNSTNRSFSGTVEIDSSVLGDLFASIYGKINGVLVNDGLALLDLTVDNSVNYSPTAGYDFYLNPKLRNNNEPNPATIINSRTNEAIAGATFEGFSFIDGMDGWMEDEEGHRCLRVLAGSKLIIPYNAYSDYIANNSAAHSLAIEIDFAVRNITNEESPIFTMGGTHSSGRPVGVYMLPLNGAFSLASVATWLDKDISWQEGVRTHVIYNIQHDYIATNNDTGATATLPIVRTFVGGVINRECELNIDGGFSEVTVNTDAGKSIIIGQDAAGCDIDIYAIRIYKTALSAAQCLQNRLSSFGTGAERLAFKNANDLLVSNRISLAKCLAAGLNCIVWYGAPVNSRTGNVKQYGIAEIYRHSNGVLDKAHSGKLYGIEMKGQGTTAMNYAEWNVQYKEDKKSGAGHDEYKYNDGGTLKQVFVDADGNVSSKFGYRLESSDPNAKKLVGKINYASSMQSHKMGACNLYNDLYRLCVANSTGGVSSVTNFSSGERVTVKEEPFLYFLQQVEGENDNLKVFQGLMTFGPGKADKPTWGVSDSDLIAGDCILEGSDNNNPLTDMRVPFVDDGTITYSEDSEAFMYNGRKNLGFDYGDTASLHDNTGEWQYCIPKTDTEYELPTTKQVKMWQPIINFLYLTNTGIRPWEGTLQELNNAAATGTYDDHGVTVTLDTNKAYWMTANGDGYNKYDLFRAEYTTVNNVTTITFVPAGIRLHHGDSDYRNFDCLSDTRDFYDETDMWYTKEEGGSTNITLNLSSALTLAATYFEVSQITLTGNLERQNLIFINALSIIFRHYVDQNLYLHKGSNLFHHETMKMWAGTDNRSKNTYYRMNPTYRVMEMNDDDLDTIAKTNNVGKQSKPYYILEHDTDSTGENGYHWQGQDNALNNNLEYAYSDRIVKSVAGVTSLDNFSPSANYALTLPRMMNTIFNAMKGSLVSAGDAMPDGTSIPQTVYGCFMKYFLRIQRYFPAVAYNETARIRYEPAYKFHGKALALSQSLGDQYDSEAEYFKRRVIFLSGYAREIQSTGIMSHRGHEGNYAMALVPHFWLYPTAMSGGSQSAGFDSVSAYGDRVEAGGTANFTVGVSGDGTFTLFNATNMKEIGNMASWPMGSASADMTVAIVADRLVKVECYVESGTMNFIANTLNVSQCVNVERIDLHNAATIATVSTLINLIRLKYLDLRGTSVTEVILPQTTALEKVYLPAGFEKIQLTNTPNLDTLSLAGYASLTEVTITSQVAFSTLEFIRSCFTNNAGLQTLTITNIAWTGVTQAMMEYICGIPNVNLTGSIVMTGLDFNGKVMLVQKFGNIDDENNPLHITYAVSSVTNVYIAGEGYFCDDDKKVDTARPAASGLRRDVFNDGTAVTTDGVTTYNGHIIKAYRLVGDSDNQNSISSATWTISGAGVTNGYFELVHRTADGNWVSHEQGNYTDMICYIRCLKPIVNQTDDSSDDVLGTRINIDVTCSLFGNQATMSATYRSIAAFNRAAKRGDFVYHDGWYDGLTVVSALARYMKINDIEGDWFDMNNITLEAAKDSSEFVLLTTQPSNWSTMYKKYYKLSGGVYIHPTETSAPTFAANTYYYSKYRKYIDSNNIEFDAVYIVRDAESHIVRNKEVVGICYYVSDSDPTDRRMFAAQMPDNANVAKAWGIYPSYFLNPATGVLGLAYQDPFDNLYVLTTSEPSNWSTNYADYYVVVDGEFTQVTGDTAPTWQADTYYSKVAEKDARAAIGVGSSMAGRSKVVQLGNGFVLTIGNNVMRIEIDSFAGHKMRPLNDSEYGYGYSSPSANNTAYLHIGKRTISFGQQSEIDEYNAANRDLMTLNKLHKVGLANHLQAIYGGEVSVPVGQYDTLAILLWRNRTLMGTPFTVNVVESTVFKRYINDTESSERLYQVDVANDKLVTDSASRATQKLANAEIDFNNQTPNNAYDNERLFPAASYAYLYEPPISKYTNEIRQEFGITRWYLPSIGELCQIFVQCACSEGYQEGDGSYASPNTYTGRRTADSVVRSWRRGEFTASNGTAFNPDVDMFEMQTLVNMFRSIKNGNPMKITMLANGSSYWGSTEFNATMADYLAFSVPYVYCGTSGSKASSLVVRPSAAF